MVLGNLLWVSALEHGVGLYFLQRFLPALAVVQVDGPVPLP